MPTLGPVELRDLFEVARPLEAKLLAVGSDRGIEVDDEDLFTRASRSFTDGDSLAG